MVIERASLPSGGPVIACRSASSTDNPSVATNGLPPRGSGSITSAASAPWNAPAASSVRDSTSSRSIDPASSPKIRLRRPSSSARSRAPASSLPSSSIRAFRLATTSATRSSVELSERQRTTSRARRSTTRAPKPTLMPIRTVVVIGLPQEERRPPTHCSGVRPVSPAFESHKNHGRGRHKNAQNGREVSLPERVFAVCEPSRLPVPCLVRLAGPAARPTFVV